MTKQKITNKIQASIFGGALGDSFGAAVEIWTLEKILNVCGPYGVRELLPYDPGDYLKWSPCGQTGIGVVTDDTCMSSALSAALVVARERNLQVDLDGKLDNEKVIHLMHQSFLQWGQYQAWAEGDYSKKLDMTISWPIWFKEFCFSSGAGKNTLAALNSGIIGTVEKPITMAPTPKNPNTGLSEGCGGMMRVAPVAFMAAINPNFDPYIWGCRNAAITHGGAVAQTASGAIATLIKALLVGLTWECAIDEVLEKLQSDPKAHQTLNLIQNALKEGQKAGGFLDFNLVEQMPILTGAMPVFNKKDLFLSHSVLVQAFSICAALQQVDGVLDEKFKHGLTLAVTHSGDSDSVGAIVGNILGAQMGMLAIPMDFWSKIQNRKALEEQAKSWQDLSKL